MTITPCRGCAGTRYALDYSPGLCRWCWGTGREHVPCLECAGRGGRSEPGHWSECSACRGKCRLDTLVDASRIDLQRQRAAEAERTTAAEAVARVEAQAAVAPELEQLDDDAAIEGERVELDEDADRTAREAWDAAMGSQLRQRRARAA